MTQIDHDPEFPSRVLLAARDEASNLFETSARLAALASSLAQRGDHDASDAIKRMLEMTAPAREQLKLLESMVQHLDPSVSDTITKPKFDFDK